MGRDIVISQIVHTHHTLKYNYKKFKPLLIISNKKISSN